MTEIVTRDILQQSTFARSQHTQHFRWKSIKMATPSNGNGVRNGTNGINGTNGHSNGLWARCILAKRMYADCLKCRDEAAAQLL